MPRRWRSPCTGPGPGLRAVVEVADDRGAAVPAHSVRIEGLPGSGRTRIPGQFEFDGAPRGMVTVKVRVGPNEIVRKLDTTRSPMRVNVPRVGKLRVELSPKDPRRFKTLTLATADGEQTIELRFRIDPRLAECDLQAVLPGRYVLRWSDSAESLETIAIRPGETTKVVITQ